MSVIKTFLLKIIKGYQKFISPLLPARCRYYPTCSNYGIQAIQWHGVRYGGWLTLKRVCSCHPLGGHGIDFVPLPLYQFSYYYIKTDTTKPQLINGVYISKSDYNYQLNQWLTKK